MKALQRLLIALCLFVISCQSAKQPDEVVKEYLTAVDKFDYKATKEMLVENDTTKMLMQNMEIYEKSMTPESKKAYISKPKNYEIKPAEIDGNNARVKTIYKDGEMPVVVIFSLKKTDKGWLINNFTANF